MRLMLPDERRARFKELAKQYNTSHAALSRLLGRGDTYFARYVRDAVPYDLSDADRGRLARFFGVDERTLQPIPPRRARRRRRSFD